MTDEALRAARAEALNASALAEAVAEAVSGATINQATVLTGGIGSLLDRIDLAPPHPPLVLRRLLPEFGERASSLRDQVLTHAALSGGGLPVPLVRWSDPEGHVLGRPALLMDLAAGVPIVGHLDDPAARRALADVASALHALDPAVVAHLPTRTTAQAVANIDRQGPLADSIDDVALAPNEDLVIVHGDLHGGNAMWDGATITALLDWADPGIANRWSDIAYLWMDTALVWGVDAADDLVQAYEAAAGVMRSPDTWHAWCAVALVRALPSPVKWLDGFLGAGLTHVDEQMLDLRFRAMVDTHLGAG